MGFYDHQVIVHSFGKTYRVTWGMPSIASSGQTRWLIRTLLIDCSAESALQRLVIQAEREEGMLWSMRRTSRVSWHETLERALERGKIYVEEISSETHSTYSKGGSSPSSLDQAFDGPTGKEPWDDLSPPMKNDESNPDSTWVRIRLVNQNGVVLPHRPYRIVLANGEQHTGQLDHRAEAYWPKVPPGTCQISCPFADSTSEANVAVETNEHLAHIAVRHGFESDNIIWNHPANAHLRTQRDSPYILGKGDGLVLPPRYSKPQSRSTGTTHEFQIETTQLENRIIFEDFRKRAISGKPTHIDCLSKQEQRTTNGQGEISFPVERNLRQTDIEILHANHEMVVGGLDPIEFRSGQEGRLSNLDYWQAEIGDEDENAWELAIEEFRADQSLPVRQPWDDSLQVPLKELHGS
jgi:hypothetical protein